MVPDSLFAACYWWNFCRIIFGDGLSGFLVEISFGYLDRISSGPGVRRGVCRGRSTRHKWELGLSKGGDEIDEPFGEIDLH